MIPFSPQQFHQVFADHNLAIWPAQIVALLVGAAAAFGALRGGRGWSRATAFALALLWLFTGVVYHGLFFAAVNPAAPAFAAAFVLQAGLLVRAGMGKRLAFGAADPFRTAIGVMLAVYGAILHPAIGLALDGYPNAALFGVTPCSVTLFTLGLLLLGREPVPVWLLPVPLLWSLIGGSAAILIDVPQDWVLLAAGPLVAVIATGLRTRHDGADHWPDRPLR